MRELKCPSCGRLNPDIREIGYKLPATCGHCPHIWRAHEDQVQRDGARGLGDEGLHKKDTDSSWFWSTLEEIKKDYS